jgi:hypothetical protein
MTLKVQPATCGVKITFGASNKYWNASGFYLLEKGFQMTVFVFQHIQPAPRILPDRIAATKSVVTIFSRGIQNPKPSQNRI